MGYISYTQSYIKIFEQVKKNKKMVLTFKKILSIRTIPLIELQILEKEKCTLHITARLMLLTCAPSHLC